MRLSRCVPQRVREKQNARFNQFQSVRDVRLSPPVAGLHGEPLQRQLRLIRQSDIRLLQHLRLQGAPAAGALPCGAHRHERRIDHLITWAEQEATKNNQNVNTKKYEPDGANIAGEVFAALTSTVGNITTSQIGAKNCMRRYACVYVSVPTQRGIPPWRIERWLPLRSWMK